jgi:hypothetical protein
MFESVTSDALAQLAAARSDAAVGLTQVSLSCHSDEELLELLRCCEQARRREAFFDQTLLAELAQRGVASRVGYHSMIALLRDVLRLSPHEASARLRAAEAAGPRQAMDGQPIAPLHPVAATAQAEGVISPGHLRVITEVLDRVPAAARAEWSEQIEVSLVTHAAQYDPATLVKIGRRLIDLLDPDGTLADDADRARRRELTLLIHPDGTGTVRGTTDAHLTELLAVVFDSLASPKSGAGTPSGNGADEAVDTRTPGMRRHDALIEVLRPVVSGGQLRVCGGIPATVLLTATTEEWESSRGLVRTGHGALITVPTAQRIAGGDARLVPVILGKAKEVLAYGTGHRIFSKAQRHAIIARDHGCTWPGCDRPPTWCETNHVIPWAQGGETSVANGPLLCARDHQNLGTNGWTATMINGRPHYLPPRWLDPGQRPRRNHLHDPLDSS